MCTRERHIKQMILPESQSVVCTHTHASLNYVLYTNLSCEICTGQVCIYCLVFRDSNYTQLPDVIWIYSKVLVEPNLIAWVCMKTLAYFVSNTNVCLI